MTTYLNGVPVTEKETRVWTPETTGVTPEGVDFNVLSAMWIGKRRIAQFEIHFELIVPDSITAVTAAEAIFSLPYRVSNVIGDCTMYAYKDATDEVISDNRNGGYFIKNGDDVTTDTGNLICKIRNPVTSSKFIIGVIRGILIGKG